MRHSDGGLCAKAHTEKLPSGSGWGGVLPGSKRHYHGHAQCQRKTCWWQQHHAGKCSSAAGTRRPLVRIEGKMSVELYRDLLNGHLSRRACDLRLVQ
ncbi:unnamed protein product [Tetraodon nigroviridis]|uniref:(spotted green pufferfish) hypothetical protein n=1 Tax=Tetraodon nigroviridis TaxID=99883 RepID=Q4RA22_TETNG|nr:unnamed protein product [Tetraodon nigroviridis]